MIVRWRWALFLGDLAPVAHWLAAQAEQGQTPINVDMENFACLQARVHLAQGDYASAITLLTQAIQEAEHISNLHHRTEDMALLAVVFARADDPAQAQTTVERLLLAAEPDGYIRTIVDEGEPMRRLLLACRWRHGAGSSGNAAQRQRMAAYIEQLLSVFAAPRSTEEVSPANPPIPLPSRSTGAPATTQLVEPLSEREVEVLRLVAQGLSNSQIAEGLVVTVGAVKRHLNNIFGKLAVGSRTQALLRARELGLL
jgi:LuxR family maltose regulon positive regulatory protein